MNTGEFLSETQPEIAESNPQQGNILAEENHMKDDSTEINELEKPNELSPILYSLHLSGVDSLSTQQIKKYLDNHIKPNYSFNTRKQYTYLEYSLVWINDSEINIVFDHNLNNGFKNYNEKKNITTDSSAVSDVIETETKIEEDQELNTESDLHAESIKGASETILLLTDFQNICKEHREFSELPMNDQFIAVSQAPKLQDRKCWDLILTPKGEIIRTSGAKNLYNNFMNFKNVNSTETTDITEEIQSETIPENSKIIKLEIRYSTILDKKVKNSRELSKYYLINGEPDKIERLPSAREHLTAKYSNGPASDIDLITNKQPETQGLFGYEGDRDARDIIADNKSRRYFEKRGKSDKWRNDKFLNSNYKRYDNSHRINKGSRNFKRGLRNDSHGFRVAHNNYKSRRLQEPDLFPDFGKK